eukprot:scaffold263444_cov20-Prasinocladus_malaysianus.AAC.1
MRKRNDERRTSTSTSSRYSLPSYEWYEVRRSRCMDTMRAIMVCTSTGIVACVALMATVILGRIYSRVVLNTGTSTECLTYP